MHKASASQIATAGMLALAAAMGIGRFAFTPLLPMMHEDYGVTVAQGSWLATANYLGYLAGALAAMAVRTSAAAAIGGGLAAIGATTLGMGIAHDYAAWLVLRAVAGVASAWVLIYLSAWSLERLAALDARHMSGRIYAGVGLGTMATGVANLAMMHAGWSADAGWIAFGALSLLALAVTAPVFFMRSREVANAPSSRLQWNASALRLVVCFATAGFGYIVAATFLPTMAKQLIDDPAVFGWSWPVFGAAALGSTLAAPALRNPIPQRRLWAVSQFAMAAGVAVPALSHTMAAIIISGLLVGGTFMVITMAALQEARTLAGAQAVGLLSAMTAAFALGQMLGPLSVSLVFALGGGLDAALLLGASVLIAGGCALLIEPRAASAQSNPQVGN